MTTAPSSAHPTETAQAPGHAGQSQNLAVNCDRMADLRGACVGFAFDTYTLLVLTLIVRPALTEMLPPNAGPAVFNQWMGILFMFRRLPAGFLDCSGGYLIDLLGRRRILTWSILLYGVCTFGSAYVTSPGQFLLLRCGTFVGVSVEFVAATAWLAELFTHREQREADDRIYAGVCLDGRPADQRRLLPRGHLQPALAIDSRRTRSLALYRHFRTDSGDSPDRAAAISSRIADLETKEGRGNAEAPELRGALPSGISQDGADHLPDDGLLLCGIVWDAAAFRTDHSRNTGSADPAAPAAQEQRVGFLQGMQEMGGTGRALPDGFSRRSTF